VCQWDIGKKGHCKTGDRRRGYYDREKDIVRERERERVCVCVCKREKDTERKRQSIRKIESDGEQRVEEAMQK
jgi:hypothetical protein